MFWQDDQHACVPKTSNRFKISVVTLNVTNIQNS